MYQPSLKEFLKLSKKANVIPLYKEISGDLDTPVSSFIKLKKDDYGFLFESVEGGEKIARYSFIGLNPLIIFKSNGRNIQIEYRDGKKSAASFIIDSDPLAEIEKIMSAFKTVKIEGLPRFCGGFVGFLGYDIVRFFEKLPDKNPDDLKIADAIFIFTNTIVTFDHINHTIKIIVNCLLEEPQKLSQKEKVKIYKEAIKKIELIQENLRRPINYGLAQRGKQCRKIKIISNFTKSKFCGIVNKAKEYIKKGEIIQVVLSQRFKVKINKQPFDIYRDLRSLNPSPYMFFLKLNEIVLIGSSPELLVRCEDGLVESRPIAGTRKRGSNGGQDSAIEKELLSDAKEKAEHLMLLDLGRNDLGRVCKPGTVCVGNFMKIERYSHVMHLVSDVSGALDKKYNMYDVLRAVFPAGTVSGAPKVRAMEIIDELENVRRGPYAGCVGYFSFSGNMDTCITIRTICVKDNIAYIQAGAGIVADSVPEKEYLETVNKAKALMEAIKK